MKIISGIEISYFRSIYYANFDLENDVNVFIGENDSGKSNIIKALNLFFNNETEINHSFDFEEDLCRFRREEVRGTRGRANIWIRVTFNNFLKWRSLPENFSIKRTWNRYFEEPADDYPDHLAASIIGRFLNRVSFHYVPAIKSKDIFSYYLALLHDSLIEDEKAGLVDASENLSEEINRSTKEMSRKIESGLGIKSAIKVPGELRGLFEALDFSTEYSRYDIPLRGCLQKIC